MDNYLKKTESIEYEKKVFVFDLHDVLFKRNYWQTLKLICLIKNKFRLLCILLKPSCLYDALRLLTVTRVGEAYLIKLSQRHHTFAAYVEPIIDITNAIKPINHMFKLITKLKHNNHKVYIFSNIGKKTFEKLMNSHRELFSYFDGIHYVEEHNDWLAKPSHDAYKMFLKKFNIDPATMVFVDDKDKNIKAAHALGITAFIYRSQCTLITALKKSKIIA